jgi:zinc protease
MKTIKLLLSIIILFSGITMAQVDRTKKPVEGKTPKFTLPKIQRSVLSNGLKVMLVEHGELPVVQMQFIFQTGAVADPIQTPGIANLTMRLLDAGTKKRTVLQIADEIDYLGASLRASTSYDGSFISVLTLKKHLSKVLDIVSDVLQNPAFPQSEFERIKKEVLTNLLQQKDRPEVIVGKVFSKVVYGDNHPYGNSADGTEASVNQITVNDVKNFYETYFYPNNATLVVVGNIKLAELKNALEKYLSPWKSKEIPALAFQKYEGESRTGIFMVDKPKAAQSQIRVGSIGVSRSTPDYFALEVMNMILGGNFNSRINWNLREQKGYTYGARSGFAYRKEAGPFTASGGFKSIVTDSCVSEILKEIKKIKESDVTSDELVFAKNGLIRALPRTFETPAQISGQLANLVLYSLPDDYYNSYIQNIDKISVQDVRNVSEKYLNPDKMAIVIVGDVELNKGNLEKLNLGQVNLLDANGKPVK